jgi:DNA-binding transcriptional LysR family regulator
MPLRNTITNDLDLNLFSVVVALYQEGTVTKAAAKVGVTQPTISKALKKLRSRFGDELFVQTTHGMEPTPRGRQIAKAASQVLTSLEEKVFSEAPFDPATSETTFTFAMSEVAELFFYPRILRTFKRVAPHAQIRSVFPPADGMLEGLESGEIDLAIGTPFPELETGRFFKQRLFCTDFVCVMRADNATRGTSMSREDYVERSHLVVFQRDAEPVCLSALRREGLKPKSFISSSHYFSLPRLIEDSDAIATVPTSLGVYFAQRDSKLKVMEAPFKTAKVTPHQYWHNKFHSDPRNEWLRRTVKGLFTKESDFYLD